MLESLRPALKELERAAEWGYSLLGGREATQGFTIAIQTKGRAAVCGWFAPERWATKEGDPIHEITIAAEHLYDDPLDILGIVLHEVVHLYNHDLGMSDTAKSGRHNKTFLAGCEAMGLECEKGPKGYAYTTLGPDLKRAVEKEFKPNYKAFALFRTVPPKGESRKSTRAWSCGCTTIRSATKVEVQAICNLCENPFQEKE